MNFSSKYKTQIQNEALNSGWVTDSFLYSVLLNKLLGTLYLNFVISTMVSPLKRTPTCLDYCEDQIKHTENQSANFINVIYVIWYVVW